MSLAKLSGETTDALNGKLTFEQSKNRIVGRDADNLIRMLMLGDGTDFVIKISKDGFDALTATSDQLIFNSSQNVFKIVQTGTVTLASPNSAGSSTNTSVVHGLGYQPLVLAFVSFSPTGTRYPLPYLDVNLPTAGTIRYEVSLEVVNNTTITFFHRDITNATNITDYIKYYILQETAS